MAKRLAIPPQDSQLRIVGPKAAFKASRVQNLSLTTDLPTNEIRELGNQYLAGLTQDTANITVTFSAFDTGIKIFATLVGQDPAAYPAAGVDIASLGEADVIIDVKDADATDIIKSGHGKRLQVQNFTFNYSVDGDSTEDYTMVGSEKRWFRNDVIVDKFVTGTTSFTLSQTPIQLKNSNYGLSVIVDGVYMTEVTGAPATGEYRIVGTTLTTGDTRSSQVLAVYHANPAGNNWTNLTDADMPAAIRGKDVPVLIAANNINRVQSVTINGNLNTSPVREMGTRSVVGYQSTVPTIDGTITVSDTDLELLSLFTTGSISGVGVTEFITGENCPTSGVSLEIKVLDPCDTTVPYTVLKTVYLDHIILTNDAWSAQAAANSVAQQTFSFRSTTGKLNCLILLKSRNDMSINCWKPLKTSYLNKGARAEKSRSISKKQKWILDITMGNQQRNTNFCGRSTIIITLPF